MGLVSHKDDKCGLQDKDGNVSLKNGSKITRILGSQEEV